MPIAIASDHAGFELKSFIIKALEKKYELIDCGTNNDENSVDYPDFANKVAEKIIKKTANFGILICGSGVGISIAANRFKEIRAALCYNQKTAQLSRQHNDANIVCLGARMIKPENAIKIVEVILRTNFEGGRHNQRIAKLSK